MFARSALLTFALTALIATPALADKGGKGRGHEHEHQYDGKGVVIIGRDRDIISHYIRDDYRGHCPPGLAKKRNGCQPPGQAKKYKIGYPLPRDVAFIPVSDDLLRQLQPLPRGYQYVRVDQDVLLVSEASKKVIDAITLLSAVGN